MLLFIINDDVVVLGNVVVVLDYVVVKVVLEKLNHWSLTPYTMFVDTRNSESSSH